MGVLENITCPADLRELDQDQLIVLAAEIRRLLVDSVCHTGGHLGSNLGVVELTIALHRVFDSPRTPIIFDTGHQAYVHKMLTGRADSFATLRQGKGLSGYPSRSESEHDVIENSHASTALSYADGLSRAFALTGQERTVVAVVGDGALTGGLAWEALNNLAVSDQSVVVVINDNGRSYAPSIGGLPRHLGRIAARAGYRQLLESLGAGLPVGQSQAPSEVLGGLGLDYFGPVDGHDIAAMERALTTAAERRHPVVVHCRTRKGQGYRPAEVDEADRLHSVGRVDVRTGRPAAPSPPTWTDVFSDALSQIAEARPDVIAVSAAMIGPTGLAPLQRLDSPRCVDTGIAEQHAVASAAGMAMAGAHPVVALYATFAGRAFDQALLDVGLHRLPVTFVLDRAGITGPDGPSHHGMWDLCLFGAIPGMRVAAPRDPPSLVDELTEAVTHSSGPTMIRFPKATADETIVALERWRGLDVLRASADAVVLVVPIGVMAHAALQAVDLLAQDGIHCTVVDPRWALPVNPALLALSASHRLVVTVEDGVRAGGVGSRISQCLADAGCPVPVLNLGLPTEFVPHDTRAALLARFGLDPPGLAATIAARVAPARARLDIADPAGSDTLFLDEIRVGARA